MATFTFPLTMSFIVSIVAEHEGEARLIRQRDINEILADEAGKEVETDNGVSVVLIASHLGSSFSTGPDYDGLMRSLVWQIARMDCDEAGRAPTIADALAALAEAEGDGA